MDYKHDSLKTNKDVFLDCLANSPEFIEIASKIPDSIFIGLDRLIGKIQDPHSATGKELLARASEISQKLKIRQSVAVDLLLGNYGIHKFPKVRFCQHNTSHISTDSIISYQSALETIDDTFDKNMDSSPNSQNDSYIHLEIYAQTTKQDIDNIWPLIKELQKNYLAENVRANKSKHPELAYCIYRQKVLANRKLSSIFNDYLQNKLDGYNHEPSVIDYSDFRKYYLNIVKGILLNP